MFWLDLYNSMYQEYFAQAPERDDNAPCNFMPIFAGDKNSAYYCAVWSEVSITVFRISTFRRSDTRILVNYSSRNVEIFSGDFRRFFCIINLFYKNK